MLSLILRTILSSLKSRRSLALENLALRHQLEVLKSSVRSRDRVCLFRATVKAIAARDWLELGKSNPLAKLGGPVPLYNEGDGFIGRGMFGKWLR